MKTISILGSTGSIGRTALDVIRAHREKFCVKILVAHNNWQLLAKQAEEFCAQNVVILNSDHYIDLKKSLSKTTISVHSGMDSLLDLLSDNQDIVLSSLIGIIGLKPTYHALGKCKIMALANKEALICAGSIITERAKYLNTEIIPVDSEHSAIFQCLVGNKKHELRSITLTASGGPFRDHTLQEMKNITKADALRHPTWLMGEKITIDSSTLFNKGLEFIEAMYLFDLKPEQIEIVIHPQSIIHSMVTYKDGSTIAQLSRPTMSIPIAYAINFPDRLDLQTEELNLPLLKNMTFFLPDFEKFPLLKLAIDVAKASQAEQIIANCANEYAVQQFLNEKISFMKIYEIVAQSISVLNAINIRNLEDVFEMQKITDMWCSRNY